MTMLEVTGIDAFYGDSQILNQVSLAVDKGRGVALLGRNGAGKSTLMKSIIGGGPRVQGAISLDGTSLSGTPTYRRARMGLALVPEDRRIFAHLSVVENLELARRAAQPGVTCYTAGEMFDFFPALKDLRERKGNQLSGGQQQILALARGFVSKPKCLLLDEPTEGVAPQIVKQMAEHLNEARRHNGTALLVAEQNITFARACSEYVYVIDIGRIVFAETWDEFDRQPEIATRYLAV